MRRTCIVVLAAIVAGGLSAQTLVATAGYTSNQQYSETTQTRVSSGTLTPMTLSSFAVGIGYVQTITPSIEVYGGLAFQNFGGGYDAGIISTSTSATGLLVPVRAVFSIRPADMAGLRFSVATGPLVVLRAVDNRALTTSVPALNSVTTIDQPYDQDDGRAALGFDAGVEVGYLLNVGEIGVAVRGYRMLTSMDGDATDEADRLYYGGLEISLSFRYSLGARQD